MVINIHFDLKLFYFSWLFFVLLKFRLFDERKKNSYITIQNKIQKQQKLQLVSTLKQKY
jgi:hypothetical protein